MIVITLAEKEEINASPVHESKSDFAAPPPREVRTLAGPSRERYSIPPPAYDDLYLPSTSTTSSSAVHGHQSNSPTPYASPTPLSLPYASPYPSPSPSPTLSASALLSPGSQPYPFAVPPTGAPSTDFVFDKLPGDNPKGFMGRMKGIAPGKSSTALLNPPPPSFRRQPPADIAREPFPIMVLVGEGASVDKGFAYVAPEPSGRVGAGSPPPPHPHDVHPFRTRDVYEQDWRLFLHDVRLAGSLSPMNKVVSGLTPLATGIGMVWPAAVYRGVETLMRKSKVKGPVSQLIDYWNNFFFHPRGMHVSLTQGPPKYVHVPVTPAGQEDKKWRLVVSYRPAYLEDPHTSLPASPSSAKHSHF